MSAFLDSIGGRTRSPAAWCTGLFASGLIVTLSTIAPDLRSARPIAIPLMLFGVATIFAWVPWMVFTWKAIPVAVREKVAPGLSSAGLVGRHFIPVYWFYWVFAAQGHLANAVDVWLDQDATLKKSSPHGTAVAMVVATLVCLLLAGSAGGSRAFIVVRLGWLGLMMRYDALVARGLVADRENA